MRYVVATAGAALVILGGCLFVWSTNRALADYLRQQFLTLQRDGKLPAELQGVDPDKLRPWDLEVALPPDLQSRLNAAALLTAFGPVLAALVLLLALGTAFAYGRLLRSRPA